MVQHGEVRCLLYEAPSQPLLQHQDENMISLHKVAQVHQPLRLGLLKSD